MDKSHKAARYAYATGFFLVLFMVLVVGAPLWVLAILISEDMSANVKVVKWR